MDLDDGVMVNSAALWPLLEPQWKDPKKWWKELANAQGKKDYDWSHLAARYFPTACGRSATTTLARRGAQVLLGAASGEGVRLGAAPPGRDSDPTSPSTSPAPTLPERSSSSSTTRGPGYPRQGAEAQGEEGREGTDDAPGRDGVRSRRRRAESAADGLPPEGGGRRTRPRSVFYEGEMGAAASRCGSTAAPCGCRSVLLADLFQTTIPEHQRAHREHLRRAANSTPRQPLSNTSESFNPREIVPFRRADRPLQPRRHPRRWLPRPLATGARSSAAGRRSDSREYLAKGFVLDDASV